MAEGALVLVGTPIGNLGDLSPRAAEALRGADVIACEDTRRTGKLLAHLAADPRPPFRVFDDHAGDDVVDELVGRAAAGETVVVVSDAGMPVVSDPGHRLVAAAVAASVPVDVVPGPSALDTAVAGSGLVAGPFVFEGFLPRKGADRARRVAAIGAEPRPVVCYEAPHRLARTIADLRAACGDERLVHLARELTKLHQERWWGTLAAAEAHVVEREPRGEYVVVLGPGAPPAEWTDAEIDRALARELAEGGSTRDAASTVAQRSGRPKRALYARAVELRDG